MTKKQVYTTNLVIVIGFLLIGFWKDWFWGYAVSAFVTLVSVVHFNLAKLVAQLWMMIGKTLGNINAKVLLTLFYFIFLLPIAWIKKLFGKKESVQTNSNWKSSSNEINFNNPF